MDISVEQSLNVTASGLESFNIIVLDPAPDAPLPGFFVLTAGIHSALQVFRPNGGMILASADTMAHGTNYYG